MQKKCDLAKAHSLTKEPIVQLRNLHKSFFTSQEQTQHVLSGLKLDIYPGQVIAITGPSGEGKSTLLSLIAHLDLPDRGNISFPSYKPSVFSPERLRRDYIGMIFQNYYLIEDMSVLENLSLLFRLHGEKIDYENIDYFLHQLDLFEHRKKPARLLSGGQKQRLCIARALVRQPSLILADEPTGNLDHENSLKVFELLYKFTKERNCACLVVTHDREIAKKSDLYLSLREGQLKKVS